ncbi:CHASE2 domain-containing protein [uncultured Meiothermus sp.]|uniref:CHASE2 domain-containing protein n=1 Tax=uncultured Meiothermus sp. TaxID=157471 RepID=UPI00262B71A2|nr:CHASE2 domain-containing protein [uncultured Meiothermus sp.]
MNKPVLAKPSRRRILSPYARKALWRTGLVVLVMVASSYILSHNLLGPFGAFIKGPQGASLDRLTIVVHRWGSPVPIRDFPLVVLVELQQSSIEHLSSNSYVFNRGQLARITQKILAYQPKGIFLDLDLRYSSNEGSGLSAGDRQLLEVLERLEAPVLVPDNEVLGQPLGRLNANLHAVQAQVLYDRDGQTRQIPRPLPGQPVAASLGLYCLGLGIDLREGSRCQQVVATGNPQADGKRIVYREIRRYGAGIEGPQLWPNLVVMGGLEFLNDGLVQSEATQGALFLVGRTYPKADDVHFAAIGPVQGIDIHLNALLTLATYRNFSETLGWGPVLLVVPLVVFLALWLTYSITEGWLKASRFQGFVQTLIETAVAAWFLFLAGVAILQYSGHFLDYLYPIVAFQMGALLLKLFAGGKKNESKTSDRGQEVADKLKEIVEGTGGDR